MQRIDETSIVCLRKEWGRLRGKEKRLRASDNYIRIE